MLLLLGNARDTIYIPFFTSISPHIGIIDGGGKLSVVETSADDVVVFAVPCGGCTLVFRKSIKKVKVNSLYVLEDNRFRCALLRSFLRDRAHSVTHRHGRRQITVPVISTGS
jgi:hypothetical protein